ncbi:MAG: DNA polymerase III subunit beta [Acidiferrobacterales bacterium]
MKISIQRDDLIKPLSYVAGIVEKRQTLPILSNILIKCKEDKIELTGTDLEVEIITTAVCENDNGETTLPARKLLDICRSLPSGSKITIEVKNEKAIVKSGRSRFSLMTMQVADFPNLETSNWETELSLDQTELKGLLERTQFCMAQQDVRYYLNGLLLEIEKDSIKTVATDGHRMAISEIALSDKNGKNINPRQIIIPRKGVIELSRFLGDSDDAATIQINPNHIRVTAGEICFTSKLIDGRFPDYNKVIPSNQSKIISLEKEAFKETLQRTAILSNEKYRGIRFEIKPKVMKVSAHNPEQEEAQEEIPIDYEGDEMEIGFNSNYIVDAVSALQTKEVEFALSDANSSSTICSPGDKQTKYVVMPMRL